MRRAMKVLAEKFEAQEKKEGRVWTGSWKGMYRWFHKNLREAVKILARSAER